MLYTIGHSNQSFDQFLALLAQHQIAELVDVRSSPASRFASQFDRPELHTALPSSGIKYTYLGDQLGGRPGSPEFYDAEGHALYSKMAQSRTFTDALEWLIARAATVRLAIMCSEENPAVCHRHLLIARVLRAQGIEVTHIRGDGALQSYEAVCEADRAANPQRQQVDMFGSKVEEPWRSLRSVLPANRPPSSSEY
jgi:uncharacterized protein (DUF488 family)